MKRKKAGIYTKNGDSGKTNLFGNTCIKKDSIQLEACGTIDELCAVIFIITTLGIESRILTVLTELLDYCHDICAEIASDEHGKKKLKRIIKEKDVHYVESLIDEFDAELPKLNHFIVSLQSQPAAFLNLARTICRRAERRLWTLSREIDVNLNIMKFFNRLSDLFFTFMRYEDNRL